MTYDSYIFDMDGTLWDAVDGYCDVWNAAIGSFGIDCPRIDRERLFTQMGKPSTLSWTRSYRATSTARHS